MRFRGALLVCLVLLPAAGRTAHAQEQIARLKSAPQDYRDRVIRLEGEAVEVRGLSPRSGRGVYRVVDGTDPVGVLIRTTDLPGNGGPFRIQARLSPELLSDGILLLDEIERDTARSPMLPISGVLGALGLIAAALIGAFLFRARRTERHLHLGPPMWLIPTGQEQPEAATGTPARFNYNLQYIEEERSELLERRKRRLLGMLALASGVGVVGIGWFFVLRSEDAARPAFVLLAPGTAAAAMAPADTTAGPEAPRRSDDSLRLGLVPPPAPPPAAPVVISPPASRRDTARPARRAADSAARSPQVVASRPRDTAASAPPPQPPPPPAATPEPVAAPPVERRDSARREPAAPPRPDPEAMRLAAVTELTSGIQRLVGAINAHQNGVVAGLYSPGAEEARRRDRLLGFLREYSPTVDLASTTAPILTETSAGSAFTLQFHWRGNFGVERKQAARFEAAVRRDGDRWVFAGARLLENFP